MRRAQTPSARAGCGTQAGCPGTSANSIPVGIRSALSFWSRAPRPRREMPWRIATAIRRGDTPAAPDARTPAPARSTRTSSPRASSPSTAIAGSSATPLPAATNFLIASMVGISTGICSVTRRLRNVSSDLGAVRRRHVVRDERLAAQLLDADLLAIGKRDASAGTTNASSSRYTTTDSSSLSTG